MKSTKIRRLIKRFENAVENRNSMTAFGAALVSGEEEYKASKKALYAAITRLEADAQLGFNVGMKDLKRYSKERSL